MIDLKYLQIGAHPVCTSDDGQWSEGLISAVSIGIQNILSKNHSLIHYISKNS